MVDEQAKGAQGQNGSTPGRDVELHWFLWDNKEFEWKVWFDAVKSFKEGGGEMGKAEDKRELVLADGKPVLKDLADWMNHQKTAQSNGKLILGKRN